jgi:hypothetical protein
MKASSTAAALALLLLAGMAPAVAGDTGPFVVFISLESRPYSPGEVVDFTVSTFARGEPAVPDGTPEVRLQTGASHGRLVPVSAAGPGRWTGSYTVLEADADDSGGIDLEVTATFSGLGGDQYQYDSWAYLSLAGRQSANSGSGVSISAYVLECPDGAVRPQSRVTFSVCATKDGAPVPAGNISFWATFRTDSGSEERTDLVAEESGPGRFLVPYTVPAKTQGGYFRLAAGCDGVTKDYLAYVPLDFFNVIYHELARKGSAIEYELLVSDRSGNPVNGSAIVVWLTSYSWGINTAPLELGRTDQNGKVRGVADLGPGVGFFTIIGWANTSKCSQYFSGTVQVSDAPSPGYYTGEQFYIKRLFPAGYLASGGARTLRYVAYYAGAPIRLQELDCYVQIYRRSGLSSIPENLSAFSVATGDDGSFSLNVTIPDSAYSYASVRAVGPGPPYSSSYYADTDTVTVGAAASVAVTPWANATFSRAVPGQAVRICASAPAGSLVAAKAYWEFSYNGSEPDRPWMVLNTFTWYYPARAPAQSSLRGQLVLPRQLKVGQNLTVTLTFVNSSGQTTTAGFPLRVRGAAAVEAPADMCCIASIFVVNAALIVLLFFNYLAGRRGEPRRRMDDLDADGQIGAVLGASRSRERDLSLPIKVELAQSEECTACGRRIAQGNLAWRCVCGARYHEHCTGDGSKCPSCGREWKRG